MFEIINDDEIWFDGVRVARFEPGLWATLRERVEAKLGVAGDYNRDVDAAYDVGYEAGYEEGERAFGKDE